MDQSLLDCGFKRCGGESGLRTGSVYQFFADIFSITLLRSQTSEPQVYISSHVEIPQDAIDAKVSELLEGDRSEFSPLLLEWVNEKLTSEDAPGFYSSDEDVRTDTTSAPFCDGLTRSDRPLVIYTWGRKLRKKQPDCVQRNFNAAILNGKRKGVNLKKLDGRSEEVQGVVKKCKLFADLMGSVQELIERENLHIVAFNCSKGRHRSVAAAELLRQVAYPNAEIVHLEL